MKVCIIHATAGAGHKKAAEAIYHGFKSRAQHEAVCIDALDYTNPFFKKMYPASYVFCVTKLAWAWEFFFWLLDRPILWPLLRLSRRIYNGFNTQLLEKFLIQEKFDTIFCTHFLSAEVLGHLKRGGKISSKVVCCVTDFDVHRIWVNQGIDEYTVACDFTKKKLLTLGVPAEHIHVTGIPVDEKFCMAFDVALLREKFRLTEHKLTILMATGSFGIGPMAELIEALKGYQLLVVCGHNKSLYEELKGKNNEEVHIFGLVDNMHELMAVSDIMVTKPGGLSVAEALTMKLPMIFFSAIPGQETGNINVLRSYGAGDDQMPLSEIAAQIRRCAQHHDNITQWRQRLAVLSKPNAVSDIIKLCSRNTTY